MLTGWMSSLGGFLSSAGNGTKEGTSSILPAVSSESMESAAESASSSDEAYMIPTPDFTLTDQYGKIHSLSQYRGKVVFLNFWASWCGPCATVSPIVEEIAEENADTLKVGKVNVDEQVELMQRFHIASIPMFIVVKDGEVAKKSIGLLSKEELLDLLK